MRVHIEARYNLYFITSCFTHQTKYGSRLTGYGGKFDYSKMPDGLNGYFPLYNSADFRNMMTGNGVFGGTGYLAVFI